MTIPIRLHRTLLAAALLAGAVHAAAADPHSALVLRAEGAADAATRVRVDALVLRLAKQGGVAVTAGDITFSDAAAAVGCTPEAASCREDVMSTLSVDEIVTSTTYVSGGELKVVVRRTAKGAPTREATATVAMIDNSDTSLEAGIGPLFGVTPAATKPATPAATKPATPASPATPAPAKVVTGPLAPTTEQPHEPASQPPPAEPGVTGAPDGQVAPLGPTDSPTDSHRRLEIAGVAVGGGAILLGFLLWGAAGSTETELQNAPSRTAADLQHIRDLENQGDSQANGGNFMFVAGLAIGGVSGYLLYRDHKRAHAAQHARITPMLVDHGAGVALTFGGS